MIIYHHFILRILIVIYRITTMITIGYGDIHPVSTEE